LGVDIISFNSYNGVIMEMKVFKYILVDWTRPPRPKGLNPKPISMTEKEAHDLNKALAFNRQDTRYVKL